VLNKLKLGDYVIGGLLFWGIPSIAVTGPKILLLVLIVSGTVWLIVASTSRPNLVNSQWIIPKRGGFAIIVLVTIVYVFIDEFFGRGKLGINLFLNPGATDSFIDTANAESSGGGKGFVDLLGTVLIFLPFALLDISSASRSSMRICATVTACIFVFYDVGISRGYLAISIVALVTGGGLKNRNLIAAAMLATLGFLCSSLVRGDFDRLAFQNPFVDSLVFPYINLGILIDKLDVTSSWYSFVGQSMQKIIPGFIISKEIFPFNIQMTLIIYPQKDGLVDSVSVFTYLAEFIYYKPGWLTAVFSGIMLGILSKGANVICIRLRLTKVRVFAGLMSVVLLRSRISDAISFLLALCIFLLLWLGLCYLMRRIEVKCEERRRMGNQVSAAT